MSVSSSGFFGFSTIGRAPGIVAAGSEAGWSWVDSPVLRDQDLGVEGSNLPTMVTVSSLCRREGGWTEE